MHSMSKAVYADVSNYTNSITCKGSLSMGGGSIVITKDGVLQAGDDEAIAEGPVRFGHMYLDGQWIFNTNARQREDVPHIRGKGIVRYRGGLCCINGSMYNLPFDRARSDLKAIPTGYPCYEDGTHPPLFPQRETYITDRLRGRKFAVTALGMNVEVIDGKEQPFVCHGKPLVEIDDQQSIYPTLCRTQCFRMISIPGVRSIVLAYLCDVENVEGALHILVAMERLKPKPCGKRLAVFSSVQQRLQLSAPSAEDCARCLKHRIADEHFEAKIQPLLTSILHGGENEELIWVKFQQIIDTPPTSKKATDLSIPGMSFSTSSHAASSAKRLRTTTAPTTVACKICTYHNRASSTKCEMCEHAL